MTCRPKRRSPPRPCTVATRPIQFSWAKGSQWKWPAITPLVGPRARCTDSSARNPKTRQTFLTKTTQAAIGCWSSPCGLSFWKPASLGRFWHRMVVPMSWKNQATNMWSDATRSMRLLLLHQSQSVVDRSVSRSPGREPKPKTSSCHKSKPTRRRAKLVLRRSQLVTWTSMPKVNRPSIRQFGQPRWRLARVKSVSGCRSVSQKLPTTSVGNRMDRACRK